MLPNDEHLWCPTTRPSPAPVGRCCIRAEASDPEFLAIIIYLLVQAQWKPTAGFFNGRPITLQPGQLITGRFKLASQTGVHASKVQRVLEWLKNDHLIDHKQRRKNGESHKRAEAAPVPGSVASGAKRKRGGVTMVETWQDRYWEGFGCEYHVQEAKDLVAARKLLKTCGNTEKLMRVATQAWELDGFLGKQSATIAGFASKWNEINAALWQKRNGVGGRGNTGAAVLPPRKPGEPDPLDGIG